MPPWRLPAILVVSFALVASACGDDSSESDDVAAADPAEQAAPDDDPGEPAESAPQTASDSSADVAMPAVEGELGTKPIITVDTSSGRPRDLVTEDLVVGDGEEAVTGATVRVQYVGVLAADGTPFDASWDRGTAFDFQLGSGQVIAGWDEGVAGMRVGGRRTLMIPADQAYGPAGSGSGAIGPDADLVFVVDLVAVIPPVAPADEPEVDLPDTPPDELVIDDLTVGDGPEIEVGSSITVQYVGVALSTGEVFDSSWQSGRPLSFQAGAGQLIPGFDQGVLGMRVGGRRQIVIPPDLGYGADGAGGVIGPEETLVFVIDAVWAE